ncbi:MAG: hypothetical protein ACLTAX_01880 [Waltera sp.]
MADTINRIESVKLTEQIFDLEKCDRVEPYVLNYHKVKFVPTIRNIRKGKELD